MVGTLDEQEMNNFLKKHCFAHLSCRSGDQLYLVPISYVFEGDCIYGQTKAGLKIDMMRKNPDVCVQVEKIQNIAEWTSVISWGKFEELHGQPAIDAMAKLIDHLGPQIEELGTSRTSRDITPPKSDGKPQTDIVYCIHITEMTGRFERP